MVTLKNNMIMRKNIYWLLLATLTLFISACDNDRDNYMVDDSIGLLNPNYVNADVYTGMSDPFQLFAIKSGKGNKSAQVSISVDEAVLENYNATNGTSYILLPSNCYSITVNCLNFDDSDYRKAFEITWNQSELSSVLGSSNDYVIPLRMKVDNASIKPDETRLVTVVKPQIKQPYIAMENKGLYTGIMPTTSDLDERDIYMKVEINYFNRSELTYKIEVDQKLLTDYNIANGTNYKLLPETAYQLSQTTWTIPANMNSAYFKLLFKKKALMPDENTILFGDYVIPIRIASVSSYEIDPTASSILYMISFQPDKIDKKGWSVIDYNTSSKEDEIPYIAALDWGPEKLIDNNNATFWGSKWTTPKPLPYYFVFDMGKEHKLFKMGFENPIGADAWRGDAKAGYIEYSSDNQTWTHLTDWTTPNRTTRSISFGVNIVTARYIKFVIDEVYTPYLGGSQMNIAEFNVWGE